MTPPVRLLLLVAAAFAPPTAALAQPSNIVPNARHAWAENVGWTDWRDAGGGADGVIVGPTALGGRVWGENVGWISLGDGTPENGFAYKNTVASDHGVNLDHATDRLSGYGWGENVGWVAFDTASLGPDAARFVPGKHAFSGYAWGENVGWIRLGELGQDGLGVEHHTQAIGLGKAGTGGIPPGLRGYGGTGSGELSTLVLKNAAPSAPVLLVIGLQSNPTPYVDGLLYPVPILTTVTLFTDPTGTLVLPAPGTSGPPVSVALQFIVGDPGATFGQSLSNGLLLTVGA